MMESLNLGLPLSAMIVFAVMVVGALAIDLYAHRSDEPMSLKSASIWSVFWIGVAVAFGGYLHVTQGAEIASLYFTGYALEKALSVDNLFVFMAIFAWFGIHSKYRHRILYWGVIGAIVFRAIFVALGTSLLAIGPWAEIVFALIIAYCAVMMLKAGDDDEEVNYGDHIGIRIAKKFWPLNESMHTNNFFVKKYSVNHNKPIIYMTPLFVCLIVIELSDVVFAFDSVPAVIAVSKLPAVVYPAMLFAVLGLRSLYFVLEALKDVLVHLEKAIIALLFFIAGKLVLNATDHLLGHGINVSTEASLYVVLATLAAGVLASLIFKPTKEVA